MADAFKLSRMVGSKGFREAYAEPSLEEAFLFGKRASFFIGFEKAAAAMKQVATVALVHDDKILMGKRRDDGGFTTPGGHLEEGEKPLEGAVREVMEEAGIALRPIDLTHLTTETVTKPGGEQIKVHAYRADVGKPRTSMKEDPDQEVHRWRWYSKLPARLHVPLKHNVLFKAMGLKHDVLFKAMGISR